MEIEIKNRKKENVMENIAFIKALLIKKTIDNLEVSYQEKEQIKEKIIEHLDHKIKKKKCRI